VTGDTELCDAKADDARPWFPFSVRIRLLAAVARSGRGSASARSLNGNYQAFATFKPLISLLPRFVVNITHFHASDWLL
jgi:hypothetical protein